MNDIKYGHDAIDYAESAGLTLGMYNSPIEDARDGLSVDEAREIAHEDPSLIWISPRSVADYTIAATEGGVCQKLWTGSCTLEAAQDELAKIAEGLRYSDYVDADYADEIPVAIEILVLSDGANYAETLEVEMQRR